MIRIIIAEDNEVVRKGLSRLLSAEDDMTIVDEAADGAEVPHLLAGDTGADIVLADLNMPDMDDIELTRRLAERFPAVRVMILTMHTKIHFIAQARDAGAKAYLFKQGDPEELVEAIRRVAAGENLLAT